MFVRLSSSLRGKASSLLIRGTAGATLGLAVGVSAYGTSQVHAASNALHGGMDPDAFINMTLTHTKPYNYNTDVMRFALSSKDARANMPLTSYVLVKENIDGKDIVRPYTPIATDDPGYMTLLVKHYENGVMSKKLHGMKPGDKIAVKGPCKKLPYSANQYKTIGMIAGGTGITPMLQLIEGILADSSERTKVKLIFANKDEKDILLKERLDDLNRKYSNFTVHYVLENADSKHFTGSVGFVNANLLKELMPGPKTPETIVMVCGPPGMMQAVCGPKAPDYSQGEVGGILKELNYNKDHVYKF